MTFKKPTRAGLLALIFGVLLGICLTVSSYTPIHAQEAAPAADAGQPVDTLSCDSKVQKECSPNSGDTAWMMTSMAIVLMMTIPGLALFYGGMVRKKNVGDTVMTSFAVTCLVTIVYAILTYSTSFTTGGPYLGGFSRVFLQGILSDISNGTGTPNGLAAAVMVSCAS